MIKVECSECEASSALVPASFVRLIECTDDGSVQYAHICNTCHRLSVNNLPEECHDKIPVMLARGATYHLWSYPEPKKTSSRPAIDEEDIAEFMHFLQVESESE